MLISRLRVIPPFRGNNVILEEEEEGSKVISMAVGNLRSCLGHGTAIDAEELRNTTLLVKKTTTTDCSNQQTDSTRIKNKPQSQSQSLDCLVAMFCCAHKIYD